MDKHNPYEDLDLIDPWDDDEDESGDFSFVEDEYDGMNDAGADGLGGQTDEPAQGPFPQTMVRPALHDAPRRVSEVTVQQQAPKLHRRQRRKDKTPYDDRGGYVQEPQPQQSVRAPKSARAPRRERRHRRHHFGCLVHVVLFACVVVGLYWLFVRPIDERLSFSREEEATLTGALSWAVPTTPQYILALGSDAREGEDVSRTDTMMLVRIDFWKSKITLLSIPRDTLVDIEGVGSQKINAAYAYGGAGGAVRAVSNLVGRRINHVAVVHFEELSRLVDYLGGVTVNVPTEVFDPDFTGLILDSGLQTLDGETALALARTRYGFATGDFQRQENQQALLSAIVDRMLSLSPLRLPGLVGELSDLVGTDLRCYNLAPLFLRLLITKPTIYSAQVPAVPETIDGISYVIADTEALARMMDAIDAGRDPALA